MRYRDTSSSDDIVGGAVVNFRMPRLHATAEVSGIRYAQPSISDIRKAPKNDRLQSGLFKRAHRGYFSTHTSADGGKDLVNGSLDFCRNWISDAGTVRCTNTELLPPFTMPPPISVPKKDMIDATAHMTLRARLRQHHDFPLATVQVMPSADVDFCDGGRTVEAARAGKTIISSLGIFE